MVFLLTVVTAMLVPASSAVAQSDPARVVVTVSNRAPWVEQTIEITVETYDGSRPPQPIDVTGDVQVEIVNTTRPSTPNRLLLTRAKLGVYVGE